MIIYNNTDISFFVFVRFFLSLALDFKMTSLSCVLYPTRFTGHVWPYTGERTWNSARTHVQHPKHGTRHLLIVSK